MTEGQTQPGTSPENLLLPSIRDVTPQSLTERTLEADPGAWAGAVPVGFGYQWEDCNNVTNSYCTAIEGETEPTLTVALRPFINDNIYRLRVTASNAFGTSVAVSERFAPLVPSLTLRTAPAISGAPVVEQELRATSGDWVGLGLDGSTTPPVFEALWQRCDANGVNCIDVTSFVPGFLYFTYPLTPADLGSRIRSIIRVTGSGGGDSTTASTELTGVVTAVPGPPNLAPDPNVEADPSGAFAALGTAAFSWVTDASRSSSHALKITSASQSLARWMTRTELIPVTPGATYTVTAWLRTTASTTGTATLAATFYAAGAYLPSASSPSLTGQHDWTESRVTATAPAKASFLRVEVRLSGPERSGQTTSPSTARRDRLV